MPKPIQQELKEEIKAEIETEQPANWVYSIATFFLPFMPCVNPLRRYQETLSSVWVSQVRKLGKWFTSYTEQPGSMDISQRIKETRLPIGQKIE